MWLRCRVVQLPWGVVAVRLPCRAVAVPCWAVAVLCGAVPCGCSAVRCRATPHGGTSVGRGGANSDDVVSLQCVGTEFGSPELAAVR